PRELRSFPTRRSSDLRATVRSDAATDGCQLGGLRPGLPEWSPQSGGDCGRRSGAMAGVGFGYRAGGVFRWPYAEPGGIRAGYGAGMFLADDGIGRPEITPGS